MPADNIKQIVESLYHALQYHELRNPRQSDVDKKTRNTSVIDLKPALSPIIYDGMLDGGDIDGYHIDFPIKAVPGVRGSGLVTSESPNITIKPAPGWNKPTYKANIFTGEVTRTADPKYAGGWLLDVDPEKQGPRLRAAQTVLKMLDGGTLEQQSVAHDKARELIKDLSPELSDKLSDKLKARIPGYLLWGGGGALLGRLIAGKNRRLLGYGLGAATGVLANYLRRKSYYGSLVGW